jgi:hypothetical protein
MFNFFFIMGEEEGKNIEFISWMQPIAIGAQIQGVE